jgi:uncharacterized membrane protein YqjE
MSDRMSVPEGRRFTRQPTVGASAAAKAVVEDVRGLVQAEVALAQAELQAGLRDKAAGAGLFAAAGVAGWLALQGLLITLGFVIALFLPGWAAALIVTALLLLVAGVAALIGRRKLATPVSVDTTKRNVQEDLAVAKTRLRRG